MIPSNMHRIYGSFTLKRASVEDICLLSRYHYRPFPRQPYVRAWKICESPTEEGGNESPIGVIVYSMPVLNCGTRRIATNGFFDGGDKPLRLRRLNRYVRRISRVIMDPRYRGLGLASRLVRETMPMLEAPMVEATAVMGQLSGFFEQAGMRRFEVPLRPEAAALKQVLLKEGITEDLWIDAGAVQNRIDALPAVEKEAAERKMHRFIEAYGRRRAMPAGIERTRFIMSRLCAQPSYYIWINPKMNLRFHMGNSAGT